MDTETKPPEPAHGPNDKAAIRHRPVTDPREMASLVMTRMNVVIAKKDELALAIHRLSEITQQLTRSYGEQLLTIEQLRSQGNAPETSKASDPPSAIQ
jgi:hypothetical protein